MRPIKFRGMRADGKGMVYGDLIHLEKDFKKIMQIVDWSIEPYQHEIDPSTLGQYWRTINGVDVYEGDIVESEESKHRFVVAFHRGSFVLVELWNYIEVEKDFKYGLMTSNTQSTYGLDVRGLKQVGSIHTNPEMI